METKPRRTPGKGRRASVGVSFRPEQLAELDRAAEATNRDLSSIVREACQLWLDARKPRNTRAAKSA